MKPIQPTVEDLEKLREDCVHGGRRAAAKGATDTVRQVGVILAVLNAYENPPRLAAPHTLLAQMAGSIAGGIIIGYENLSPGTLAVVADAAVDTARAIIERIQATDPELNQ